MYVFLQQFKLNILHIPGCRNELCDFLSRGEFENKFQLQFEEAAKDAFQRMDAQLDLFFYRKCYLCRTELRSMRESIWILI